MNAPPEHLGTNGSTAGIAAPRRIRPRVLLIEENPLTAWVIEKTLAPYYDVVRIAGLAQAQPAIDQGGVDIVICGSPISDDDPAAVRRLARARGPHVIALVSDPDCPLGVDVPILEKPFSLSRLVQVLDALAPRPGVMSAPPARPQGVKARSDVTSNGRNQLAERLQARFEREICPRCVHETARGGCTFTDRRECPVFEWAQQLAALISTMESERLGDYLDRIQAIICPTCMQDPTGICKARNHLDCPLDLYLGLVVPIVEDELRRGPRAEVPNAGDAP